MYSVFYTKKEFSKSMKNSFLKLLLKLISSGHNTSINIPDSSGNYAGAVSMHDPDFLLNTVLHRLLQNAVSKNHFYADRIYLYYP